MKLSVKTLKGISFVIDVSPDDKISDVKKNIENTQGQTVYPADQQMLIYQGKILSDDAVLNDHKVTEGSFMVVMLKKATVSSSRASTTTKTSASTAPTAISAPANPSTPVSAPAVAPPTTLTSVPSTTPTPAPGNAPPGFAVSALSVPSTTPTPAPGNAPPGFAVSALTEGDVYGQAASNLVAGSNFEGTVQQILEMGGGSWDRETVIRALRAAFNNPERAVDYLYSGIPAQAEAPAATQAPATGQPVNPSVQVTQPSQPAAPTTGLNAIGVPTSGPNANPLDLFPQGLPNLGANAGGNLDFLRDSPQFRAFQTMVQSNPQILQPMLQELAKQNPQILRLIQEHQSEFLGMINEPAEGGDSNLLNQLAAALPQQQQQQQHVTVTPEEHEAIERLEAMGFDRNLVLQVFFACNKNEELAANYLLDHMHEFDE